jgi:MiaB-like tRNA modifying enzyme
MITRLKDFIIVDSEKDADIVVVNSCTVTNSADANIRSYISKQNKDGKRVILAGCGAFSKGEELLEQKKIFGVFGHSQKENINELLKRDSNFYELGDLKSVDKTIVSEFKNKTKAFIKIQEGCNFECSYCIIPSVRGKARSQDEKLILEQIKTLAKNGFGEFVLTGTNMGSYGRDKGSSLAKLLKRISKIDGVKRVRLGSIEPIQIDDEFKELLGESFLEKHLHIALQHTHKSMLKLMKRRNSLKKDLELFEYIADKGFALGTDFIVGHPGETQKIWQEAVENFKKFPLTHLHIFTFSKRDGTHSATLKDEVRGDIAKKRLKELKKIVKNNNYNFRKKHSKNLLVLVEENNQGYDQYFNLVKIDSKEALSKSWVYLDSVQVKKEGNFAVF